MAAPANRNQEPALTLRAFAPLDWPPPWEFTAPESHVLAFNGGAFASVAFRLAVQELVARQILRVEAVQRRHRRRIHNDIALYGGACAGSPVALSLAPVLRAYDAARRRAPDDGVLLADLATAARAELGTLKRYHELHVVPVLVDRGMLERGPTRRFRTRPDVQWTAAGRDAEAALQRWLTLGRERLAHWQATDHAPAIAYAHAAGTAVLLAEDLYPNLEGLASRAEDDTRHHEVPAAVGVLSLDGLALKFSMLEPLGTHGEPFARSLVEGFMNPAGASFG